MAFSAYARLTEGRYVCLSGRHTYIAEYDTYGEVRMLRLALLLAFGVGFAGSAQAQTLEPLDPWSRQVQQQLWMYRLDLGLTDLSHNIVTGALDAGERETVMAELEGGSHYTLLAVCDNDCTDIDLRVKTRSGTTLDEDLELDDFPLCEVSVAGEGTMMFEVEVIMVNCDIEPCSYAVAVFER
jgi:hypothetical protein